MMPFLTLKVPITTAADDTYKYFFNCFSEKIRLDVSSESSARQRIHLKNQALLFSKDKSKKLKCYLLQFLFGALRVNALDVQLSLIILIIDISKYPLISRNIVCSHPLLFFTIQIVLLN